MATNSYGNKQLSKQEIEWLDALDLWSTKDIQRRTGYSRNRARQIWLKVAQTCGVAKFDHHKVRRKDVVEYLNTTTPLNYNTNTN